LSNLECKLGKLKSKSDSKVGISKEVQDIKFDGIAELRFDLE